jgi:REP element-mobilizing transposase RayT
MANTYSQIYFHIVIAVRRREALIEDTFCDQLYKYIAGILLKHNAKPMNINGYKDHIHILLGAKPTVRLDDLMREVKEHSTRFINDHKLTKTKFYWQSGYAAFSVSQRLVNQIYQYIARRKEHHRSKEFLKEIVRLLKEEEVEFDQKYIFAEPGD